MIRRYQSSCELIGFHNPIGKYPAHVVPLIRDGAQVLAVYRSGARNIYRDWQMDLEFEPLDDFVDAKFNPDEERLFAYDPFSIAIYNNKQAPSFFRGVLSSGRVSDCFLRLEFAKLTRDDESIWAELMECVQFLEQECEPFLEQWYSEEHTQLTADGIELPKSWRDLKAAPPARKPPADAPPKTQPSAPPVTLSPRVPSEAPPPTSKRKKSIEDLVADMREQEELVGRLRARLTSNRSFAKTHPNPPKSPPPESP